MNKHLRLLFYLSVILTSVAWIFVTPIWHFPDEQAHFGQIAFMANKWRSPQGTENDLTREIYLSEIYLGTARDNLGNNRFTFHPEYRIEYTQQLTGKYEKAISESRFSGSEKKFVHQEAARYPPFYYLGGALVYKLFENTDLFTRIFMVRLLSAGFFLINIYYIFKIGKMLLPADRVSQLALTVLSSFQPMMVFTNVGVNSDSLGNLLMTLFLYYSALIIKSGWSKSKFLKITGCLILGIYTKPQFIIMLPLFVTLFIAVAYRDMRRQNRSKLLLIGIILFLASYIFVNRFPYAVFPLVKSVISNFDWPSFFKFTAEYTVSHTYREVLPWYWGIFNWLGVTYPRIIHRVINGILIASLLGFVWYLIDVWRKKEFRFPAIQIIFFFLLSFFLFAFSISLYDWYSWRNSTYVLGIQGRYYMPFISVQMAVILIGWNQLFSFREKLKIWSNCLLSVLMILLNFFALFTVASSYYNLADIRIFIIQASQYKPYFAKGIFLALFLIAQFILTVGFLLQYFIYAYKQSQKNK